MNIASIICNYLNCPAVNTVIFSYGFHGKRKEVFENVQKLLADTSYKFLPVLLWCEKNQNIKRMLIDNRDNERIKRAVEKSRKAYENID